MVTADTGAPRAGGVLPDVAATVLELLCVVQSAGMTCPSLRATG